MPKGRFINLKSYDFEQDGKHFAGTNMYCLVDKDVVKVKIDDEQAEFVSDCQFGDEIALDVRVKGRFANYILAV